MNRIFVYNGRYREHLPREPRPPAIKITGGVSKPMQCISGVPNRFQAILFIDCFDRLERQQAERWLETYFQGKTYQPEEKTQQRPRQDVQLSFLEEK